MKNRQAVAWMSVAIAIVAWLGAGWFAWTIQQEVYARTHVLAGAQKTASATQESERIHALAQATVASRAELQALFQTDPVAAAAAITQAGAAAGVEAQVSSAAPEQGGSSGGSAIGFTVEADGSFGALLQTEALLENLPFPSQVQQIDLSETPQNGDGSAASAASWHLSVSLAVLIASSTQL